MKKQTIEDLRQELRAPPRAYGSRYSKAKMEAASNPSLEDLLIERKKQKDQLVALADAFQDLRAAMRETDRVMEEIWKLLPEE